MSGILVQVRNVNRTVRDRETGRERRLLSDVSVDFYPGEVTALIGPSGCGKSTLLKAICGVEQADHSACEIYFNGDHYYSKIDELSHYIAYLPQFDSDWLHDELPVVKELCYTGLLRDSHYKSDFSSNKSKRDGRIYDELHRLSVVEKREEQVKSLSGGQKKRAAIIGAMVSDPQIMLLDEPTAPLDPGTSAEFVANLVEEARSNNLTTIMVTHDPIALQGLGDDCHVVLMTRDSGRIGFDGTYRQLGGLLKDRYKVENVEAGLQQLFVDFSKNSDLEFLARAPRKGLARIPGRDVPVEQLNSDERRLYSSVAWRNNEPVWPLKAFAQFRLLFRREVALLRYKPTSLLTLLAIPLVLGLILGLVVNKDELYTSYNMTKAMMFSLSACSFFAGVFDSISAFSHKTRIMIEEFHGMRVGSYVLAVASLMTILCFVQALIIYSVFTSMAGLPDTILYDSGLDMFLTAFFCAFSAAMLGMLCSALFSNSTYIAPVLVVIQIVFSGMIFTLDGVTKTISYFVSCHWAMNALAALCNLNELPVDVDVPNIGWTSIYYTNSDFDPECFTLFSAWLMLLGLGLGALLLCLFVMSHSRKRLFHPKSGAVAYIASSLLAHLKILVKSLAKPVAILALAVVVFLTVTGTLTFDFAGLFDNLGKYFSSVVSDFPSFAEEFGNRF